MELNKRKSLVAKILLFLTTIVWGSSFAILKDTLETLPMYFVLTVRFLGSALILAVVFFRKWKSVTFDVVWRGGVTGVVLAGAYITQTIGLTRTTPGTNAFLTATYSVMVPFMMWAITKKAPTTFNVVAALLGIVGIGLVSFDGGLSGFSFMGEGMGVICSVFFALQIIFIAVFGKGKDSILFTTFELLGCGVVMLVTYLITEVNVPISFDVDGIWKVGYLTVIGTAGALLAMTWGLENTETNGASLIMSLEAVFGVAFGIILYKEEVTVQKGVGFAVIFLALLVSEYFNVIFEDWKNKRKEKMQNQYPKIQNMQQNSTNDKLND